ncbi:MAG: hypothetical protein NUV80_01105 [Candidatus Berkelbacteria bacterium]|nr:hypothetical protein [Candidatus Berkelbacteria bacterium]
MKTMYCTSGRKGYEVSITKEEMKSKKEIGTLRLSDIAKLFNALPILTRNRKVWVYGTEKQVKKILSKLRKK